MRTFSVEEQRLIVEAISGALPVLRANIGGHLLDDPVVKDDKTLVTKFDNLVQEELNASLLKGFPTMRRIGEEDLDAGVGEMGFLIDPLDGTRAFSCGLATSTIIVGVYDFRTKEVVGCVVGEPATGRIWSAFGNGPTQLGQREVKVWPGEMNEQSTVFMDVSHGFTRKGRRILTNDELCKLFGQLNGRVKLALPGSNGLIQALVANGGQKVVGSITTAIGGPWDVCGVRLVLNAGGSAKAFSVTRIGNRLNLKEVSALDVGSYDILITGNSNETVTQLLAALTMI